MNKYNFEIENDLDNINDNISKSSFNSITQIKSYFGSIENYFVDLDLPSKTLWAKYNLGVDPTKLGDLNIETYPFDSNALSIDFSEDLIGDYYAWGEIATKKDYIEDTYALNIVPYMPIKYIGNINDKKSHSKFEKQNYDYKYILDLEDDAAYMNNVYKNNFQQCIPSPKQFEELFQHTKIFIAYKKDTHKACGYFFKSYTNENMLFIPFTGIKNYSINSTWLSSGNYWTNSRQNTKNTENDGKYAVYAEFALGFVGDRITACKNDKTYQQRSLGLAIRPVMIKDNSVKMIQ